jgi:hypothetical protein
MASPLVFVVGGRCDEPHGSKLAPGWYWGRLPWNVALGRPLDEAWELGSVSGPLAEEGKFMDAVVAWGYWDCTGKSNKRCCE